MFSYVFDVPSAYFRYFEEHSLYILVGRGGVTNPQEVFIDQKLSAVPYAIYAHNGAPTGIILPFTGNTNDVPPGWVLCDGSALPSSVVYDDLRGIVGTNTPDLRGVFLRGFGNINTTNLGPAQGAFQDDLLWEHTHLMNLVSSEDGEHTHDVNGGLVVMVMMELLITLNGIIEIFLDQRVTQQSMSLFAQEVLIIILCKEIQQA